MTARQITVIPAVDVLGDEAVRLTQGEFDRVSVRAGDPAALARRFADAGARLVHVVDLEGARRGRIRPELVARMVEAAQPAAVQASGGVRSPADARLLLRAGAEHVVVGTAAFRHAESLARYADALGDALVVALDARDGRIAVSGWQRDGGLSVDEAVARCVAAGVGRVLCTAIDRDGTLAGPDLALLRRVRADSGARVLAAGGIASPAHVEAVADAGCEAAVVGRAVLDGSLPLASLWTRAVRAGPSTA